MLFWLLDQNSAITLVQGHSHELYTIYGDLEDRPNRLSFLYLYMNNTRYYVYILFHPNSPNCISTNNIAIGLVRVHKMRFRPTANTFLSVKLFCLVRPPVRLARLDFNLAANSTREKRTPIANQSGDQGSVR
jgi:hypothetical protein